MEERNELGLDCPWTRRHLKLRAGIGDYVHTLEAQDGDINQTQV